MASSGRIVRPSKRADAEHLEGVAGHEGAIELLGAVRARVQRVAAGAGDDRVERGHLRLVVEELGGLEEVAAAGPAVGVVVDHHADHAVDVGVHRIGIQQDVLDDAEDRRRGADAEREREDGARR